MARKPRVIGQAQRKDGKGPLKRRDDRKSAWQRGYDGEWKRFRLAILRQDPRCRDCKATGKLKAATELHHIEKVADNPARRLDSANVMPLCKACHSKRTQRGE